MSTKQLNVAIDPTLKERLEEYSKQTGRSYRFVVENGIAIAIATDCKYAHDNLVTLVIGSNVYQVPVEVARAYDALLSAKCH